ncbi:UDP-N-acetylmuramate--L-alanine ligase [Patescibacteria group bacterium]
MKKRQKVFIIGIGGIGTSGLAQLLREKNYQVSGSDRNDNQIVKILLKKNIKVYIGNKKYLPADTNIVIYSPAVPTNHRLLKQARKNNLKILSYPQALWETVKDKKVIAISGTHGKSTVTAIVGWILSSQKKKPTILCGSIMNNFNTNAIWGNGEYAVIEADEFNKSFLNYHPYVSVINNIELDHFDTYKNPTDLITTFNQFINQTEAGGKVIINADNELTKKLNQYPGSITFGIESGKYKVKNIHYNNKVTFVFNNIKATTNLVGVHNIMNIAAAFTVIKSINLSLPKAIKSLKKFKNTWRRFEKIGNFNNITTISDYAHHPTEIKATLNSAKIKYPEKQIIAVFQPHQHNRTRHLIKEFGKSFVQADKVIITEIYNVAGRISKQDSKVSAKRIINYLPRGKKVLWAPKLENIKSAINEMINKNSIIIFLGAGNIDDHARKLVKK